jgi:predicted AAA+ superfamily ATPase
MYVTGSVARIRELFYQYVSTGGFPEAAASLGKEILLSIYSDILQKDAVAKYRISNIHAFRELARYLVSNVSNEFTYSKLKNVTSIKDIHTVRNYVEYITSTYLIFTVNRFSRKLKMQMIAPKKVYCVDHALAKMVNSSIEMPRIMENIVAVELYRSCSWSGENLFYWKDHQQREVDFVVCNGKEVQELIQVTHAFDSGEIREREIKSLLKASEELDCKNLTIITMSHEGEAKVEGKAIKLIPIWKWLLSYKQRWKIVQEI